MIFFQRPSDSVKLQYMSDLHLERLKYDYTIEPTAPYLLLIGDIGRLVDYEKYRGFLISQCRQFDKVLLWAGNHEFYGSSRAEALAAAKRLVAEPEMHGRLVFMDQHRYDIPGGDITILGCTLWSHVPDDCTGYTNDISCIQNWNRATHNAEHQKHPQWLRASLEQLGTE